MMINQIKAGIAPEQAERFIDQQERAREVGAAADARPLAGCTSRRSGASAYGPASTGLTIGAINVGTYADIPDVWPYQTEMPRGAYPIPGVPAMGYSIYEKAELWAENSADLYEEAIQRRWRPSTDIPWDTMQDLPADVEKAVCQVCTWLCEKALLAGDVTGNWLPEMSYGYHEVKLYLSSAATTTPTSSRCSASARSRNGGGMGVQIARLLPPRDHRRPRLDRDLERAAHPVQQPHDDGLPDRRLHRAQRGGVADLPVLRCRTSPARSPTASQHLKFFLMKHYDRRAEVHHYLNKSEAIFALRRREGRPPAGGAHDPARRRQLSRSRWPTGTAS